MSLPMAASACNHGGTFVPWAGQMNNLLRTLNEKGKLVTSYGDFDCAAKISGVLEMLQRRVENYQPTPQYIENPFDDTDPRWNEWPSDVHDNRMDQDCCWGV